MSLFAELKRRNVFRVGIVYGVVAWFLLQAADIMLENFGAPGWVFKTVAGLLALGFPLALFLSWAFELTPEGVKRSAEVTPEQLATPKTGRRIDRLIVIGLVAVIAVMAVERLWFAGSPSEPVTAGPVQKSIAVLPFTDLSPERDQEYFSDGLAEEILNLLASVRDLSVASRTSAFSFKASGLPIPEIAGRLGVNYILEGSVRKADERIRVTVQLIDARSDRHLWSENYDRTLADVFAIQDDIARSIADALQVTLLGAVAEHARPTENLEAYQLYLQGRHLVLQRGAANLETAASRLQRAVELDPGFAAAWAELGVALALIPSYGVNANQDEYFRRASEAVVRTLALAPDHAMALATRGFVAFHSGRFEEGLADYPGALELAPENETIWLWYSVHATAVGHIESALERAGRAYALSPSTGINAGWLGLLHSIRGDDARARRFIDEGIALGYTTGYPMLALNLWRAGDGAGAQQAMHRFLRSIGEPEEGLDTIIASDSDPALRPQAEADLAAHLQQRHHFSTYFGAIFMRRGDVIVEYFDSISTNRITESFYLYWPNVRSVLNDPALQAYLRRIGMVDFWRAHGWPEFCRPLQDDAFACGAFNDVEGGRTP